MFEKRIKKFLAAILKVFLPHDATRALMPQYVVRLSVRPSVTFRYDFHTGWNTSKIISRLYSLR